MMETLKTRLPWAAMGFERVLHCASMPEGERIIVQNRIDFMLLDVEVIRGTGIELLRWARERGCDAACVFLTNYADFHYAKEAVRLGSIDYVLKTEPLATVEQAIRRALSRICPDVLFNADRPARQAVYDAPDTLASRASTWEVLLLDGRQAELLNDVQAYLNEREMAGENNPGIRMVLEHDMTQIVYKLLERHGLQASAMFTCEEDTVCYRNAPNSAFDTLKWVNRFADRAVKLLTNVRENQSVAAKVHAYIQEHYTEDINRQKLADLFFIHSDHLSRLFGKEYGISIPDYIARLRIEAAKQSLRSGMNVSEAAIQVGYDNFAYFSTVFKKLVGESPSEFKRDAGGHDQ